MRRVVPALALVFVACRTSAGGALEPTSLPPARPLAPLAKTSTAAGPWDVEKMPGETKEVTIDVDEGTWLGVDVSPDGQWIAFDLLGDLYLLPVSGGTARAITSGVAWDMQPRFSPDGRWIAFISDRDGMDNVWLVDPDGQHLRQVTKDKEHEMSSPRWTPDGEMIAARRHFTSDRSLGAGEIWLYHRTGGDGLQMTTRPSLQKDAGEPAFSPDGKYLYFSQDVTGGSAFEYNKDPYGTIYAVNRLDRASGRIDSFLSAPGGSITPTPSPDGRSVAFVRRVGLKTALFVVDVESGAERMLFDGLDRDLQETWATQGVHPGFSWTPDSRSLIFWAGGKIRRLAITTAETAVIPFHVHATRKLWKAVRFPVAVAPARFETKMLRWVTVSPDGRRVVFQTLGHLWIRDLPDGKARRLTSAPDDVFEQHPAFSRDGTRVAYTTWSDRELGSVRVLSIADGKSWAITRAPGHYAEPAFSPDGKRVAYRRLGGDVTRARTWTRDPGLYVVPVEGGDSKLVLRRGTRPHFGAESDRLYFDGSEGEPDHPRALLQSVSLDGTEERTHLKVALGESLVMSPDGKRVAFTHNYAAYVAPFVPTGSPIELGPSSTSLPVVRASSDAGAWLHFSGGSRRLHWARGEELFTLDLDAPFAALEEKPGDKPKPPESGVKIGLEVDTARPHGTIALVGGRVVTMRGDQVIEDGVVLVHDDRIEKVGTRAEVSIPADAKVIDVHGSTIVPGMIDVHHHGPQGGDGIVPKTNWALLASLAFGVTTVHDPSHDSATIFAASELQKAGLVLAPRIFSTGTVLYAGEASIKASVETLDDARAHLRRQKALGAISVKSYRQRRRSQRQMLLTAAREEGMMVVPEGGSLFEQNLTQVVDGHTGVEHALPLAKVYDDVRQLWAASDVGYTPTLVVAYGGLFGENYWYRESDVFAHPRLTKFVPPFVLEPRARRRILASDGDWNHVRAAGVANYLSKAGVKVNLGAHGQREGLAAHWELWSLVQGGMTPHEALRVGTLNGAQYLGLDRDLGSIEPGKLADLMVIDGDVLRDIRASEHVRFTVLNGRVYDAQTMNEVAPDAKPRPKLYWE